MTIAPLSTTLSLNRSIAESRDLLARFQEQLATGKKVKTYGDLGVARSHVLSLRSELGQIAGYQKTISQVDIRLDVMLLSLERFREIASEAKSDALEVGFDPGGDGQTVYQREAAGWFDEATALLNTNIGDRYLFGGRETEQNPVLSSKEILDGADTRAGFKQVASERRQADLGTDGRGRLVLAAPAGTTAVIAEDTAGSPFGFKLNAAATNAAGIDITGPAGVPATIDVDFNGIAVNDGETVRFTFDLPDGTQKDLTLTARATGPVNPGEFLIDADPNIMAANFQTALTAEIETVAQRSLSAASLFAATNDFFDFDAGNPPQRVAGPPFDSATALTNATATDTIFWYQGEVSSTPARDSALAKVDDSIIASYGARANEDSFRTVMKNLAAVAVEIFSVGDANASARYSELKLRASSGLSFAAGAQSVDDLVAEIVIAKKTIDQAGARHKESQQLLQGFIDDEENADIYEVSTAILSLQGRIEASLQVSASLSRLSLVNFL